MSHFFLSEDARQRDCWRAAFPSLVVGRLPELSAGKGVIWALQPAGLGAGDLVSRLRPALGERPLVILADEPSEEEALAALAAGAAGYCNGHAAPPVLQQVALAVENGGIWVGQGLMQRFLAATHQRFANGNAVSSWRATLTAREQETAELIAKGASNKEIARQLDITERTVKAHVSAMLGKLGARDRLQLSLVINGIET